ncbi:endopolygalacturonase C [Venturia nashicola]|uniref:endo-polygalacturonase n=1 Tax=Venturia nashicola TaxID=86259 RepID=A0A4Z1P8J0_9PEZI|nr:endopolygalacturonase C [Venturia nashicola]TLD32667.1 endopolygalacturonase C [Venturia nashicola]
MLQRLPTLISAFAVAHVLANPAPAPAPAAAPDLGNAAIQRSNISCTFSGTDGWALAHVSKTACSTIVLSSLTVPGGKTLNLDGLNKGTTVIFQGNTTFGYSEWAGPLFSVSGNQITVKGDPGSLLDGQGALYWDGKGGSRGKTKPKFFRANNLNDSILDSITIINAPKNCYSLNFIHNLTIINPTIDDRIGDALGKNTDGFNINNANGIYITGAKVWNQDDCVAINSGSNIIFEQGFCSGGHGLSIGSVGLVANPPFVSNVTFQDTIMEKSQQSVRIKTVTNATGTVDNITYRNIQMSGGSAYGIIVMQSYNGKNGHPTNGVNITNFVMQNVTGTVLPVAVNVYVECGVGTCRDWKWDGVSVTGGQSAANSTLPCQNVPEGISC